MQCDGIFAGLRYYVFHNNTAGITDLNDWLEAYANAGKSEAIKCMFIMPEDLSSGADRQDHLYAGGNTTRSRYINHGEASSVNKNLDLTNTSLDGYTPKNNKLKTFPYSFLAVSNNAGNDVIYRYEDFYTETNGVRTLTSNPQFKIESCMTPSGSIRMLPENYKGVVENDNEGINLGKFPICSWPTDVYTNWLTQNGVNIALSVAGSTISAVAGGITGNAIGVASGIIGIANTLGEIYKESLTPPQIEGNINNGDVVTASGNNDFHFEVRSIKKEFAKLIDDFFSMYGYKTNEVKIPNITGRRNWNYVKTINCNLEGNIPQMDLQKIKEIFNQGVTLWHNSATFLDYTQNNDIL